MIEFLLLELVLVNVDAEGVGGFNWGGARGDKNDCALASGGDCGTEHAGLVAGVEREGITRGEVGVDLLPLLWLFNSFPPL
jgi:hypothetical protein